MEPGETVTAADICRTSARLEELVSGRGATVDVIVTDRAVYLVHRRRPLVADRVTYDEIESVVCNERPEPGDAKEQIIHAMLGPMARLVQIRLWGDRTVGLMPKGGRHAYALFAGELNKRVPDRTVATYEIPLLDDGRGARVTQSRGPGGSIGYNWNFVTDDGVDVTADPVKSKFDARMRELMRAAGDPNVDKLDG